MGKVNMSKKCGLLEIKQRKRLCIKFASHRIYFRQGRNRISWITRTLTGNEFSEFQSQYKMDRVCALLEKAIGGIACWEFPMGYVSLIVEKGEILNSW